LSAAVVHEVLVSVVVYVVYVYVQLEERVWIEWKKKVLCSHEGMRESWEKFFISLAQLHHKEKLIVFVLPNIIPCLSHRGFQRTNNEYVYAELVVSCQGVGLMGLF